MTNKILLFDSGSPEDSVIAWMLRERGYDVMFSSNLYRDRDCCQQSPPDILLLNAVQPIAEMQHRVLLYREFLRVPIVAMLTPDIALGMRSDNMLTADHYIIKPFQLDQLQALLRLVKLNRGVAQCTSGGMGPWPLLEQRMGDRRREPRHTAEPADPPQRDTVIKMDPERQDVFIAGRRLHLSQKEYILFSLLARRPGTLFDDGQIMCQVWPNSHAVTETEVRQYIYRLRRKLDDVPQANICIETVRGRGYRMIERVCKIPKEPTDWVAAPSPFAA